MGENPGFINQYHTHGRPCPLCGYDYSQDSGVDGWDGECRGCGATKEEVEDGFLRQGYSIRNTVTNMFPMQTGDDIWVDMYPNSQRIALDSNWIMTQFETIGNNDGMKYTAEFIDKQGNRIAGEIPAHLVEEVRKRWFA
jgi:hypothetical protein